jgi:hypothetical protein
MSQEDCENCERGQEFQDRIIAEKHRKQIEARDEYIKCIEGLMSMKDCHYPSVMNLRQAIIDADK